ncbi:MAG: GNAT family N-acetyltransferase [Salinibacterium sp.]|nr:GNAT family N-acetyltransferase [Salinibacterium sp.]
MIRLSRPTDLRALREICLRTGDSGQDATGLWSDDGLLPDVFLEPYVLLEPSTVWVVEADARAVGYLVATFDTRRFVERWSERWTPIFADRHPRTAVDANEQWLRDAGYNASLLLNEHVENFPAHLHIALLPRAQGRGSGRALMGAVGLAATEAGVPGIHLGVGLANLSARAFYERLGFHELSAAADTVWLGIAPERLLSL